ncbi:MAG: 3-hydroxyacyl-ACP dehydratase FabZ [Alphaproteobacteria bacterium]
MTKTAEDDARESTEERRGVDLDIGDVMKLLPHRYPFLMIDRIENAIKGVSACGIKNVTVNEPFFAGHFPGHPVMPGVLMVEAMAQTAAALVAHTLGGFDQQVVYFMTIDRARFRNPVNPGDCLRIPVRKLRNRGPVWKFHGEALVGDKVAAEAEYSAMLVPRSGVESA